MARRRWIHWLRRKPFELWFGILSLTLSFAMAMPPLRSLASYANWTPGYYYLNYWQFGFVKRGLLGSFWSLLGVNEFFSPTEFTRIHHVAALVCFAFLFWLICWLWLSNQGSTYSKSTLIFYALATASPATFLHFGFDLGRVDLIGLNLCLLALLVLGSGLKHLWKLVIIVAITVAGLLIHEAFLLFWCPVLFCGFIASPIRISNKLEIRFSLSSWLSIVFLVLLALRLWGPFESGADDLSARFQAIHPSLVGALSVELTSDLVKDNIMLGLDQAKQYNWFGNNFAITAYATLFAWQYVQAIARSNQFQVPERIIFILAPLGCLGLNLLGQDFIRALACTLTSAFLILILTVRVDKSILVRFSGAISLILVPFIFMGPLGVVPSDALPLWKFFR